jgi:hypothetical protein
MTDFSRLIAGRRIIVSCHENLSSQAESLLDFIQGISEKNGELKDGTKIQIGWSVLTLKEKDGGLDLIVYEPDFAGNPLEELREGAFFTLLVLAQQNSVLNKLKMEGVPALFYGKVVYAKGVLDQEKIYLERSRDVSKSDSGWYVGSVEDKSSEPELEAGYVYQLLQRRPETMSALTLPEGYLAIFTGNHIDAIVNEENQNIWN